MQGFFPQWARWAALAIVALTGLLSACGGSDGGGGSSPPQVLLDAINIDSGPLSLPKGASIRLSASGHFSNGGSADLTTSLAWSSSDSAVASVDAGVVQSLAMGSTIISATGADANGQIVSDQITLTVISPALVAIDIQPPSGALAAGTTTLFTASGRYTDGSLADLSDQVSWSVADGSLASVTTTGTDIGTVTAVTPGSTSVSASLDGQTGSADLTVTSATLVSIALSSTSLPSGTSQTLAATGFYTDGSRADISGQVTWQSQDAATATVDASGLLTAVAPGSTTVQASLGSVASPLTAVTVTAATLAEIVVEPANPTLPAGSDLAITALGIYSDQSVRDISDTVTWSVSDSAVAAVQLVNAEPRLTALAAGSAQLQASLPASGVMPGGTPIQVTASVLTAIDISPTNPSLAAGTELQLVATGKYSDGCTQILDAGVMWTSGNDAIVAVDGQGHISARTPGTTHISASLGTQLGSVEVTVTPATLASLAISPAAPSLVAGTSTTLQLLGTFSDGSSQDLSQQAAWQSDNAAVAEVGNAADQAGQVTALAAGTVNISADVEGQSAQVSLTVNAATLTGLSISPALTTLQSGTEQTLTVTGQFDNGSSQDVSQQVVWQSSDPAVASVSNATANHGLVTGVAAGSVTLTANLLGQSATLNLAVASDPAAPVSVSLVATPNVILADGTDSTTLAIAVQAAEAGSVVPDTTTVNVQITDGTGVLSTSSVTTLNGVASVSLTANTAGVVVVSATVAGTTLVDSTPVSAVADFSEVIGVIAVTRVDIDSVNGILNSGSRLGLFVVNLSNRTFDIEAFSFIYGGQQLLGVTGSQLQVSQLPGGGSTGFMVVTSADAVLANASSIYSLSEPDTGSTFDVGILFSLL